MIILSKNFVLFLAFLTLSLVSRIKSQNSISNYQQDFGKCNCDLTDKICDLNCCCDPSCTADDISVFKCINNGFYNYYSKYWCIPSSSLFKQNTPYIINSFTDLVCVDANNSLSLSYYLPPLINNVALKEEYVKQLVNIAVPQTTEVKSPYSLIPPPNIDVGSIGQTFFTTDDYVWTLTKQNVYSFLTLPNPTGSNCRTGPPLNYLSERNSECRISSSQIEKECNLPDQSNDRTSLSLNYFLGDFKILKKPNSLSKCFNLTGSSSPENFDYYVNCKNDLVDIELRNCILNDGSLCKVADLPNLLIPKKNGNICTNLVKSITYLLQYKNPGGIIRAALDVNFFDYDSSSQASNVITQTFQNVYLTDGIDSFLYGQKLSGNPGYQRNKPLIAGNINGGTLTSDTDINKRFTYLMPDSNGNCPLDDSKRRPIRFLQNVATECYYEATINVDECKNLQEKINNIILGYVKTQIPNYYAPFATSEFSSWQKILDAIPSATVCTSITNSLTIQIAYALIGNIINPQAQIVYVSYDWSKTININCVNCKKIIPITTRVVFVDVTQSPLYTESKIQRPTATLPGNFFYPLTSSSKKINHGNLSIAISLLLMAFS